jgi:acetyl-CoA synthetase
MKHDSVSYAVVLGVPDEKHGEALQAFVTLKEGEVPSRELLHELAWHARTLIGPQVVFKSIWFRDYIPRNVEKKMLRNILLAGTLDMPARMSITIAD